MAGSVSRGSMRGGRSRRAMADINVVPYIDVMLVLLIIFMVAAPLTTPGVIDLPSVGKSAQAKANPIGIVVKGDRSIIVRDGSGSEQAVTLNDLVPTVARMQGGVPGTEGERPVVISGDKKVEYDAIMQVMDKLRQQGVQRVGLSVQPRP